MVKWRGVYYQSWSMPWVSAAMNSDLVAVPHNVNLVYLAFAQPNCTYAPGQRSFAGTGLQFSSDFDVVAAAIKMLRNRGVTVMLSVGGATYGWDNYNPASLANLCFELGCSGIDLDWEAMDGAASSHHLGPIIAEARFWLPRPYLLSMAGYSVGCYGQMAWTDSLPHSKERSD